MVNFKENYHFSRFRRGSNIFQGGSNFFQGGGGSNCLFPIEIHITCDFPGGVRSPCPPPPLDPHLKYILTFQVESHKSTCLVLFHKDETKWARIQHKVGTCKDVHPTVWSEPPFSVCKGMMVPIELPLKTDQTKWMHRLILVFDGRTY